ncbi:sulfur carrier protein ThiS adenylyltransferase [Gammaproteobacteria bacterium]|nr:sulfur carrier protein ThiS adenylyltransferase [Gammaproteobacteria bacterium]
MSRYSRQEMFAPIGPQGQARIAASRVLLVGCGALGTHLAEFCVRAGVGELTLIDRDVLEESNLQRQSLFTESDLREALPKAEAARRHLVAINAGVKVSAIVGEFTPANAEKLARGQSLILDATDNFETRFLINDVAIKLGVPWVYAACIGSRVAAMPIVPGKTACLRCLLENQPEAGGETCETSGIIMPAVFQAVAWSSVVALKLLSGNEAALLKKMLTVDIWTGERTGIDASRPRPDCAVCGKREFEHLVARNTGGEALCGRNAVHIRAPAKFDYPAARKRIAAAGKTSAENEFLLRFNDGALEITLFADGRALVHGTADLARARAVYARWVGM